MRPNDVNSASPLLKVTDSATLDVNSSRPGTASPVFFCLLLYDISERDRTFAVGFYPLHVVELQIEFPLARTLLRCFADGDTHT
jgi:hypothetical protein